MESQKITLFHYWRSSSSWRVRWALAIKGVSYECQHINLLQAEHQQEEYLKLNPTGFVPCLQVGKRYFSESFAMLEWLEETYPQNSILPKDPFAKMHVRGLAQIIVAGVQPLQNLKAQRFFSSNKDIQHEYARFWIDKGFSAYEKLAKNYAQEFSFSSSPTIADLCLIPQVYNAKRFGIDLKNYPLIKNIYANCLETLACQRSSPENFQPK
jgi:maleylacetoacetate isomerase